MDSDEISQITGRYPAARGGLLEIGARPNETRDERAQRRLQLVMALASVGFVSAWGSSFVLIGRADAALTTGAYVLGTFALLAHAAVTRNFATFRWAHILWVLIGPWGLHLYLGGFTASGGAILWSMIAPIAAMMFVGVRASLAWAIGLMVMVAISWVRERWFPSAIGLTADQASAYFAFNMMGMVIFTFFSLRYFTARYQAEQARAERLLLNILPRPIAERLKRSSDAIAERFDKVTVVFSDLVGFTQLSQQMDAKALVGLLNEIFTEFDGLADQHGLEKIKTIGDAYMVVAGVPVGCADHADRAARMALGMRAAIDTLAKARGLGLQMRIGLHTGEVVAGVIGRRKFSYDLWGDTVNTASRMESHAEPGRIQLSAETRALLGAGFTCSDRGVIHVKGKGDLHTFWLDGAA